jgi:hypothetical protein
MRGCPNWLHMFSHGYGVKFRSKPGGLSHFLACCSLLCSWISSILQLFSRKCFLKQGHGTHDTNHFPPPGTSLASGSVRSTLGASSSDSTVKGGVGAPTASPWSTCYGGYVAEIHLISYVAGHSRS